MLQSLSWQNSFRQWDFSPSHTCIHTHTHSLSLTHTHVSKLGQALTIANTSENFYIWINSQILIQAKLSFSNQWKFFQSKTTILQAFLCKYRPAVSQREIASHTSASCLTSPSHALALLPAVKQQCSRHPFLQTAWGPTCWAQLDSLVGDLSASCCWHTSLSQEPQAPTAAHPLVPPPHVLHTRLAHQDQGNFRGC